METRTLDIPVIWPQAFAECDQCVERLRASLEALEGVQSVSIEPDAPKVQVVYDPDLITFEHIREFAEACGVTLAEQFRHQTLPLEGLDCPDCAMKLESVIRRIRGVAWASVNYAASELSVEFEPGITSLEAITKRVRDLGYDTPTARYGEAKQGVRALRSRLRLALTLMSGFLLLAGLVSGRFLDGTPLPGLLFIASALAGGALAARAAFYSLRALSLDTNVLMTAAALGAAALGEYFESAAVMFLFSLGSLLEAVAVERTRRSIRSLIEEAPASATIKRGSEWTLVNTDEVNIGEIALLRPGEKSPVDGTVVSGETEMNEAPVTGESTPQAKLPGDPVYAGSINGTGAIELRVTSRAEENTIARIVRLVEEAQSQKAPSQRFSERFGRIYTPCVIALACTAALFAPLLTGETYSAWLTRSLTLLVVSCPCALVISTPVAVVAAIGSAARNGVLIKGGAYLEGLGSVRVFAFDKTGTLTTGKPTVTDVIGFGCYTPEQIAAIAAAVEQRSEHPIASAVRSYALERGLPETSVHYFEAMPGRGARAVLADGVFAVGNSRLLEWMGISIPGDPRVEQLRQRGCSIVWVTDESSCIGAIGVSDTIRQGARETLHELRNAGISFLAMLTGDDEAPGRITGEQLGLDEIHANLMPADKLAAVRLLRKARGSVAMVGDGINDAPALAAADVGIAMGGAGSETAVEAADVALMADDIVMLPYAVRLSRRARRVIVQNVAFSMAVVLGLAAGALSNKVGLAAGVFGHEASALIVIANSMRLFRRVS